MIAVVSAVIACAIVVGAAKRLVHARTQSSYESCIAILKRIDGVGQGWALEHGKTGMDVPTWDGLRPYMPEGRIENGIPKCPQGGTYVLRRISDGPRCSIPMHSLDFGLVNVRDESGAPITGAQVSVDGVSLRGESTPTDTNGQALITRFPSIVVDDWSRGTGSIIAVLNGYETGRVPLPTGWPVVITIKRVGK
jgi:hypothetical protein